MADNHSEQKAESHSHDHGHEHHDHGHDHAHHEHHDHSHQVDKHDHGNNQVEAIDENKKSNKGEKKFKKAMTKMGMKPVTGITRVTFKKTKTV